MNLETESYSVGLSEDPRLLACVNARARGLPTSRLRPVSNDRSGAAIAREVVRLVRTCVGQGRGATFIRGEMTRVLSIAGTSPAPVVTSCAVNRLRGVPNSELARLIALSADNRVIGDTQSERLGHALVLGCMRRPAVRLALDRRLVGYMTSAAANQLVSAGFKSCLLDEIQRVPPAQIIRVATVDDLEGGVALIRQLERACVAKGVQP